MFDRVSRAQMTSLPILLVACVSSPPPGVSGPGTTPPLSPPASTPTADTPPAVPPAERLLPDDAAVELLLPFAAYSWTPGSWGRQVWPTADRDGDGVDDLLVLTGSDV